MSDIFYAMGTFSYKNKLHRTVGTPIFDESERYFRQFMLGYWSRMVNGPLQVNFQGYNYRTVGTPIYTISVEDSC